MSLTSIYDDLVNGRITHDQAAAAFGTDPTILRMRMGKHKTPDKLRQTLQILDSIAEGSITRQEAAEKLRILPRSVNLAMQTWGVVRPISEYRVASASAKVKFEIHFRIACDFIAGRISLDRAAADAKVSDRQMRRIVITLLDKHTDLAYKDLKHLTLTQLQEVSKKIMEAEEIDEVKARTLDKVVAGRLDVHDVVSKLVTQKQPTPRRRQSAAETPNKPPGPRPGVHTRA